MGLNYDCKGFIMAERRWQQDQSGFAVIDRKVGIGSLNWPGASRRQIMWGSCCGSVIIVTDYGRIKKVPTWSGEDRYKFRIEVGSSLLTAVGFEGIYTGRANGYCRFRNGLS